MKDWLHWIVESHYSIHKFTQEALRIGVSRPVSLDMTGQMTYGDRVSCIQKPHGYKSGAIFLEFIIQAITGLSEQAGNQIRARFKNRIADMGGDVVSRACGGYITGMTYIVDADMSEIAALLIKAEGKGVDLGEPMIGCRPEAVQVVPEPFPLMADIPIQEGFRTFDRDLVYSLVETQRTLKKKKRPRLLGKFYALEGPKETAPNLDIQVVTNYQRKG